MKYEYSAVIRTLGLAGDKYMSLLKSLDQQTIKPKEILVVLAEGYDLPPEKIGYERYVFSKKGIVSQRSLGAIEAKSDYCLFLDDDLEFEPTMVERLFKPIEEGVADVTFPIIPEMVPKTTKTTILSVLSATGVPMLTNKTGQYTRITKSGGWTYNENIDFSKETLYEAQTAPGACYLVKTEYARKIKFEEEKWLELTSFSLPDDQINFYKYYKLGYKIYGMSNIHILHLDGGGTNYIRQQKATYALAKHHVIFWHRFVFKPSRNIAFKVISLLCFIYWFFSSAILSIIVYSITLRGKIVVKHLTGEIDGVKYLFNKDYRKLPVVTKENY
ncbi:MAG: glycosyltransferase family 2 protein [Phocaeicola vulgatus]|nr:MAG: glycosyltransferase family 2 protein [Phocaeicola vulgatus]